MEFPEFPKIPRLNRNCVITEKIDGTNATVYIGKDGEVMAGSKNRWITPEQDNFGFAAWVRDHADGLKALGPGLHRGEWYGSGIQRGYGLAKGQRKFALFNTSRWFDPGSRVPCLPNAAPAPECCTVVPVLYAGPFSTESVNTQLLRLRQLGSLIAPGFMRPEGVIVYHVAANLYFKATVEKDEEPKSKAR